MISLTSGSHLGRCPLASDEVFTKQAGSPGRVGTLDAIESRARGALDKVPITRVTEVSRLDRSCRASVFAAVTPLAADLTTHMGKGLTPTAARISATMEAIERVCAESVAGEVKRASYAELQARGAVVADPWRFDLPASTAYRKDAQLDWVEGWDLIGARPIWVPVDLAISPPRQGVLDQVDTNGLAAGSSFGEAIRHALLEVIERDAISQHQYFELYANKANIAPQRRRLELDTLSPTAQELLASVGDNELVLEDISVDVGIPVIACTLIDRNYLTEQGPTLRLFGGWGADPCAEAAACRALTESYQSRVGFIHASRDSFNLTPSSTRSFTRDLRHRALSPEPTHSFDNVHSFRSDDIAEDVEFVLQQLMSIGVHQAIVIDLTDPQIGIPVVRIRTPGLSVFVVDRQRPGWRCARHLL